MTRRAGRTGSRPAVVVATVALLLGATVASAGVAAAGDASISVTGDESRISLEGTEGDRFDLTVATNATNVSGYQVVLAFDPAVVEVVSVSGTDDFDDPVVNVDEENSRVAFNQYRSSTVDDPRLATLTVEIVGSGGNWTALSFVRSETKLSDDVGGERDISRFDRVTVTVASEAGTTETVVPGFGATAVLAAGVTLYGYLRWRRR
ncbi:cohesin domain-containing protein [Halorubrum rubrum]|uniref:Cohesin domain-containing protein n=1 Tax=Halorubrum rubrum TaxID=1126240 RepID=A0ABD5QYY9_9EURY|nr:cohesin domain-containing protein [Halorubrum rubrum]